MMRSRNVVRRLQYILLTLRKQRTTMQALALEYEVSTKTIQRDIELLRDFGFEIEAMAAPLESGGGVWLVNPKKHCVFCNGGQP